MKLQTYYLNFTTPLHIGDYKPDSYESTEAFLRSDTIIAAIISAWAKRGHEDWIGNGDPGFSLSSAFPFYGKEGEEVRFFPRLRLSFNIADRDTTKTKEIKKIAWLDQSYFEKVINNSKLDESFSSQIQGDFISEFEIENNFMTKQISERVAIPRDRNLGDSEPFYMERIYFDNGGLYFFASGEHLDRLETALNFLQYEGFGTDRSTGNGFFTWHKCETTLNVPEGVEYRTNLGLYCPLRKEKIASQINENAAYDIVKRGGWVTKEGFNGIEKNSIYMFAEGSIFKTNELIDGQANIDLTPNHLPEAMQPNHKIYRSGRTLFIPVKI